MDAKDLLLHSLDEREAAYKEKLKLSRDEFSNDPVPIRRFNERILADALFTYLRNKDEVLIF